MSKRFATVMALTALAMSGQEYGGANYEIKVPKNKHGLTDEQIDQMALMTPKEKKKFIKSRYKESK